MIRILSEIGLFSSTVGFAALAQVDPVAVGGTLGQMGVASILGVVSVSSVWGMVKVYKDKCAAEKALWERLLGVIDANTKAMTEVFTVIDGCKKNK